MPIIPISSGVSHVKKLKDFGLFYLSIDFSQYDSQLIGLALERYDKTSPHAVCRIAASRCNGDRAAPDEDIEDRLTEIIQGTFGDGGWLKVDWPFLPRQPEKQTPITQNLIREDSVHDDSVHADSAQEDSTDEDSAHESLTDEDPAIEALDIAQIDQLSQKVNAFNSAISPVSNRKRKRGIEDEIKNTKVHSRLALDKLAQIRRVASVARHVDWILDCLKKGLKRLEKGPETHHSDCFSHQFAQLCVHRQEQHEDGKEGLAKLLDQQLQGQTKSAKQSDRELSRKKYLTVEMRDSICMMQHEEERSCERKHRYWQKKQTIRSKALNQIASRLFEWKGADAWVFMVALRTHGCSFSKICHLPKDSVDQLVSDVVDVVKTYDLEQVRDETPVFLIGEFLSWLLRQEYSSTCKDLGFSNMTSEDTGVSQKLDDLSMQYSWLNNSDAKNEECSGAWQEFSEKARSAATVTLGDLRAEHKRLPPGWCKCEHHRGRTFESLFESSLSENDGGATEPDGNGNTGRDHSTNPCARSQSQNGSPSASEAIDASSLPRLVQGRDSQSNATSILGNPSSAPYNQPQSLSKGRELSISDACGPGDKDAHSERICDLFFHGSVAENDGAPSAGNQSQIASLTLSEQGLGDLFQFNEEYNKAMEDLLSQDWNLLDSGGEGVA